MRCAVTGAAGSVGKALAGSLIELGEVDATDIDTMDVTDRLGVKLRFGSFKPDVIFHLAGAKHAPAGEEDPFACSRVNIVGTKNVLDAANGAKVILASTCKACEPVTAYGATKLIAERMVLNAGGSVARFFNVIETSGNVFRLWESLPEDEPLPVTPCARYFISLDEAVHLLLQTSTLPSGRYVLYAGLPQRMIDVAARLYPGRALKLIPPRRGDRMQEPFCAAHENLEGLEGLFRITSPHDDVPISLVA